MAVWNDRNIHKPPNATVVYDRSNISSICQLITNDNSFKAANNFLPVQLSPEKLICSTRNILNDLENDLSSSKKYFDYETTSLFSFIYQNGMFRKEKFIQSLKKLKKCVKRFDEIDIVNTINNIKEMVPTDYIYIERIRIPNSKCLYFLHHRLVGAFRILLQCISCCMESAIYLRTKLVQGHFISQVMLGYSTVARIRSLCFHMVGILAPKYDQLQPYLSAFIEASTIDNYEEIPRNLVKELNQYIHASKTQPVDANVKRAWHHGELPSKRESLGANNSSLVDTFLYGDLGDKEECCNASPTSVENDSILPLNFLNSLSISREDDDLGEEISYSEFNRRIKLSSKEITSNSKSKKRQRKLHSNIEFKGKMRKEKLKKTSLTLASKCASSDVNLENNTMGSWKKSSLQSKTVQNFSPPSLTNICESLDIKAKKSSRGSKRKSFLESQTPKNSFSSSSIESTCENVKSKKSSRGSKRKSSLETQSAKKKAKLHSTTVHCITI